MEELHTDSIDGGHEGQLWAKSRAMERAYSNNTVDLTIIMLKRNTEIEYETWTIKFLFLIKTYYATTKDYNDDQSSYDKTIKSPEIFL
jgi:hypothetical protein